MSEAEVLMTLDAAASAQPSLVQWLVLLGGFFLIMYFLVWKPEADQRRAHQELVSSLAKDDRVITGSGIHGKVVEVHEDTVVLEVGDRTRVTFDKEAVSRKHGTPPKGK